MFTLKTQAMALAIIIVLFSGSVYAGNETKLLPKNITTINHSSYLQDVLNNITSKIGTSFKVNVDISDTKVDGKFTDTLSMTNWQNSLNILLADYNWVGIQNGSSLKTVIITGKKHDLEIPVQAANEPLNNYEDVDNTENFFSRLNMVNVNSY